MEDSLPLFNIADLVVFGILLFGLIRGFIKGLSGELAGLISVVVAVAAGRFLYRPLGLYIGERTTLGEPAAYAAAFIVTLLGAYLLMLILRLMLRALMEFSFKGKIERLGGALAGLLGAAVFAAALLLVLGLWPNDRLHRVFAEDSVIGHAVYTWLGPVYERFSEEHPALAIPRREEAAEDELIESEEPADVDELPPPGNEVIIDP